MSCFGGVLAVWVGVRVEGVCVVGEALIFVRFMAAALLYGPAFASASAATNRAYREVLRA